VKKQLASGGYDFKIWSLYIFRVLPQRFLCIIFPQVAKSSAALLILLPEQRVRNKKREDNGDPRISRAISFVPWHINWKIAIDERKGPEESEIEIEAGWKARGCKKCSQRIRGGFWSVNHSAKVMTIRLERNWSTQQWNGGKGSKDIYLGSMLTARNKKPIRQLFFSRYLNQVIWSISVLCVLYLTNSILN